MKLLLIYFFVLGFICIRDLFKVKNFDDYVVAGRKQSSPFVFMSLMATVLGASATVGIAARAESIGFAAFWWLAVGAIGFWFQAAFLSKPVHDLDVRTLPEIAEKTVGKTGRKLVALIIAVSPTLPPSHKVTSNVGLLAVSLWQYRVRGNRPNSIGIRR